MRLALVALVLMSCATLSQARYVLVSGSYDGPIVRGKFITPGACKLAEQGSDPSVQARCKTEEEFRRLWSKQQIR